MMKTKNQPQIPKLKGNRNKACIRKDTKFRKPYTRTKILV